MLQSIWLHVNVDFVFVVKRFIRVVNTCVKGKRQEDLITIYFNNYVNVNVNNDQLFGKRK